MSDFVQFTIVAAGVVVVAFLGESFWSWLRPEDGEE